MCDHGDTVVLLVPIPAGHSHTGKFRWDIKPVDRCIAPIVRALNAAGIWTVNACCGHGRRGEIVLHSGLTIALQEGGT